MEIFLGVAFWVIIFLVWYARNYPDRMPSFLRRKAKVAQNSEFISSPGNRPGKMNKEYQKLVEIVENVCARDMFGSSDAASMALAVKKLIDIEKASGQIWEAYALDALETAEIWCDDCKKPVKKIVTKSGVRIECPHCDQWLELKNSKVAILDFPRKNAGNS